MVFICIHFLDSSVDLFILKTFLLLDFKCYEDHDVVILMCMQPRLVV